ncbi:hypothetical protein MOQ_005212 [Trypanosoma cruzi marinkellei]|uniref:Uncharacterized protein n=1 Tax=Trypanosoma cruzi marinkellei TaxID=85056 RepID=K2M7F0_TRYCR|nr:hypothetical protein MOQ_005212 [Trypanosoma cruzi marinkellei]
MCILAFVTQCSQRFPLVLINNRDEVIGRMTHPVGVDNSTGLLWAVDGVAGGSWLGLNVHNGRFAVLTNCTRCPTAPLAIDGISMPSGWRGAMPLAEIVQRMKVHATPAEDGGTDVFLTFNPDLSRGCIVGDFLKEGRVPGDGVPSSSLSTEEAMHVPTSLLSSPYFDGYNLLTVESLFNPHQVQLLYSTNRYAAQHRFPAEHGVIHCLQNSYLDNWMEPNCTLLRKRFEEALKTFLPTGVTPYDADYVADSLASYCLCLEPNFDLQQEIQNGKLSPEVIQGYQQVLDASLPYKGYNGEVELIQLYGAGLKPPVHFPMDCYKEYNNFQQRNIFVSHGMYCTRSQTTVVVETMPDGAGTVIHFSQRNCNVGKAHGPWKHFTVQSRSII